MVGIITIGTVLLLLLHLGRGNTTSEVDLALVLLLRRIVIGEEEDLIRRLLEGLLHFRRIRGPGERIMMADVVALEVVMDLGIEGFMIIKVGTTVKWGAGLTILMKGLMVDSLAAQLVATKIGILAMVVWQTVLV